MLFSTVKNKRKKPLPLEKIISSAKKIALTSLLIGTLSLNPLAGATQKKQDPFQENKERAKKIAFFWDVNLGYRSRILASVKDIPLEVRDVPEHLSDTHANDRNVAPIEKDSVETYDHIDFGTRLGGRLHLIDDKLIWRAGLGIDLSVSTALKQYNKRKDMEERNYTNAPGTNQRGQGAALTFHQIQPITGLPYATNAYLKPLVFSEIEAKVGEKTSLALGYILYRQNYQIRNGWDRNDKLQTKDKYVLAKLIVGGPYISVKFYRKKDYGEEKSYVSIDVGITSILKKQLTEMGKSMQLNFNDGSFYIGIRQSIYWE